MIYKSVFVFSWYQNYILFNAFAVKIGNYTLAFIFLSIDNLFVSIKFSPNTDFFISAGHLGCIWRAGYRQPAKRWVGSRSAKISPALHAVAGQALVHRCGDFHRSRYRFSGRDAALHSQLEHQAHRPVAGWHRGGIDAVCCA